MTDLFDFQAPANHFAVMGNPVAHSQSPRIHRLFARQFGIAIHYDRIQVDAGGFRQAVSHFAAHGGAGLNVTVPFKVEAWKLCGTPGNRLSARARRAEAVNTLRFAGNGGDGAAFGDNTDGAGLVRDIEHNLGWEIAGRRVLVVGAGGAVRGILQPLAERKPASVTIANRTASRARALAEKFGGGGIEEGADAEADGDAAVTITGCGCERLAAAPNPRAFDLIINGSAASLAGELPGIGAGCVGANSVAYDLMYAPTPTVFMDWALANGAAAASDGLGMLVEQAAEAFHLWHERRPDTAPVISALRRR